ncbi:MAG: hypothetical protein ABDI20_09645, partial [Candidatus Bipolaricaulaceae bacterium]
MGKSPRGPKAKIQGVEEQEITQGQFLIAAEVVTANPNRRGKWEELFSQAFQAFLIYGDKAAAFDSPGRPNPHGVFPHEGKSGGTAKNP